MSTWRLTVHDLDEVPRRLMEEELEALLRGRAEPSLVTVERMAWSDEAVERGAHAAFFEDDLGGHIRGRHTYDSIPEGGRENYRKLAKAVLTAVEPEQSSGSGER